MPTRTSLRLSLLAGLMAPLCAFALGVGPLTVRSALNENFEADIPLIINNPSELLGLTVQIPRQQVFDQAGIERLALFSKLRFTVQTPPGGPNLIKVTSIEPIRNPNFNLLLEVAWSRGRLIREFTVQVDPELYANRRLPPPPPLPAVLPRPATAPAAVPRPALSLPPAPPVSFEGASTYGPIQQGETLMAIARQVRPSTDVSLLQMMSILLAGNPEAFVNGNPNALRRGATLKVPAAQALGAPGATAPPAVAGLTTPPPAIPASAEPPATTGPVATPSPAEPAATLPSVAPPPPTVSSPPPAALGPGASATPPVAATPSTLSPAAQPGEIIPQASIPQPEAPSSTTATTPSGAVAPPADATATAPPTIVEPTKPTAVSTAPSAKPPVQPVVETESSWMGNPIVWIAIALILLAIASMVLLPLLRRPTRPAPTAKPVEPAVKPSPMATMSEATVEPEDTSITQVQVREPRPAQPAQPVAASPITADTVAAPKKPAAAPQPKSVTELLREIDFGPGGVQPVFGGKSAPPALSLVDTRLDAEPATTPATGKPMEPLLAESPAELEPRQTPSQPKPPAGLQLDGLDFDFGELGLPKKSSKPAELPPLELKSIKPTPGFAGLPPGIDIPEPPTEPALTSSMSAILSAQAASDRASAASEPPLATKPPIPPVVDRKFTFTDVTEELAKQGRGDALKLDEELQNFGGQVLSLDKMELKSPGGGADMVADYVETKLDLAAAYLDMGDQVGARGLLDEVLQEGNDSQKQRAEGLLRKVG